MATVTTALTRVWRTRAVRVVAPLAALVVVVSGAVTVTAPASAAPTRTIQQVQAELDSLNQDAANAAETWDEARSRQADLARSMAALRVRIAAAQAQYGKVSAAIDEIARAAYASGGVEPTLQALLADNPQAFLDQSAALDQVARAQGTSLRRTASARLRLAQLENQLTQQQAAAKAAADDAAQAKAAVDSKVAAAQALLASLKASERARLAALEAAHRAASERAARAAAASARAAARASRSHARSSSSNDPNGNGGNGGSSSDGNGGGSGGGGGGTPSSRARIAVAYALAQVGDRYVAGRSGPSSFDCSGLTMAAWRRAGVSLPHYSKAQYAVTQRVSRGELRPGDLLFYFGGGAHHVAMYIGGGMMVSASNPRAGVEIIAAWGPWYGSRYSGAGRVV